MKVIISVTFCRESSYEVDRALFERTPPVSIVYNSKQENFKEKVNRLIIIFSWPFTLETIFIQEDIQAFLFFTFLSITKGPSHVV